MSTNGRFLPCGSVFCKYTVKNAVPTMAQDKIPWGAIQDVRKRIFWLVPALKIKYRLLLIADKCGWLRDEYCFRKLVWNWQVFVHSMGWGDGKPIHTKKEGSSTKEKWDRQDIWQYDAQRLFVPLYYYMYYYFLFLNVKATGLCSLSLYSVFFCALLILPLLLLIIHSSTKPHEANTATHYPPAS